MGFTRYFHTLRPMTLDEVKAGVRAIKAVAERRSSEFRIDRLTETSIWVNVRSSNPVESLCFEPTATGEGQFVQGADFCKTNRCSEDEGIREMLEALQTAVNNKLHVRDDDAKQPSNL